MTEPLSPQPQKSSQTVAFVAGAALLLSGVNFIQHFNATRQEIPQAPPPVASAASENPADIRVLRFTDQTGKEIASMRKNGACIVNDQLADCRGLIQGCNGNQGCIDALNKGLSVPAQVQTTAQPTVSTQPKK